MEQTDHEKREVTGNADLTASSKIKAVSVSDKRRKITVQNKTKTEE